MQEDDAVVDTCIKWWFPWIRRIKCEINEEDEERRANLVCTYNLETLISR